jgi:hypothetical protein
MFLYISCVFQSALPAWFGLRVGGVVVLVVYGVYLRRSIIYNKFTSMFAECEFVVQLSNNILLKKFMHYSHEISQRVTIVTHSVNRHAVSQSSNESQSQSVRESLSVNHPMSQRVII